MTSALFEMFCLSIYLSICKFENSLKTDISLTKLWHSNWLQR